MKKKLLESIKKDKKDGLKQMILAQIILERPNPTRFSRKPISK